MIGLPEVHVTFHHERKNIWQASPGTAATDEHSYSFNGRQLQDFGQSVCREGHNTELGHQGNGHSFWLEKMGLNFMDLHCAANGDHSDEEDGDGQNIDGYVERFGDVQEI